MVSKKEIYQLLAENKISREEAKKMLDSYQKKQEDISYPLSVGQRELYFIHEQNPTETAYNVPVAFECQYDLNQGAVQSALKKIVKKHELLRATIENKENQIRFQIKDDDTVNLELIGKTGSKRKHIIEILKEKAMEPFSIENEAMMRVYLATYEENKKIIMFVFHHIIFDGISLSIFLKDFMEFYLETEGIVSNKVSKTGKEEKPVSYGEFTTWQKDRLTGPLALKDKEYWLNKFSGELKPFELYTGLTGKNSQNSKGMALSREIHKEIIDGLLKLGLRNNANIFHIMMSAFYTLLYRISGLDDIVIGTPTMIRPNCKLEKTIGYFINTIPLRQHLEDDMDFLGLVNEVKINMLEALDHVYYPYSYIVRNIREKGQSVQTGLYDVTFHYQSWMGDIRNGETMSSENNLELIPEIHQEGEFPLSLEVYHTSDDSMQLMIKYDVAKYTEDQAEKMLECYIELLHDIVKNPQKTIGKLNLLSEDDKKKQFVDWNNTAWEYPSEKRICDVFEENAEKFSKNIAVRDQGRLVTYEELQKFSNRLAWYFTEKGIQRKDYVLLKMRPSYEMVASILAIMKCGAAYVPLDPDIPRERMDFIMEDTKSRYIVCDIVDDHKSVNKDKICIQVSEQMVETYQAESFTSPYDMSDIAYVIYTSGSTGKPKGVEVMHKGLTNVIYGMDAIHNFTEENSILLLTTLCFDIATVELYLPLIKGGSIVVVPNEIKKDGISLKKFLEHCQVDIIQATPATWKMLMLVGWKNKQVKAITAGEPLSNSLAEKMLDACKEVWNQYGPTENTVYSTVKKIEDSKSITIGHPVANTKAYIMDSKRNIVPIGFAGELYVGGNCLAKGYLNRDDLNEKSFVVNPFDPKERLYKTGDLVRYLNNGDIDYIGRIDNQVKIRGFRIEIGEIECSILKDENVAQCAVVIKTDQMDNKRIVAYLSLKDQTKQVSIEDRKKELANWLPSYMIPSTFIILKEFPITLSGKIDRKTLEQMDDDEVSETKTVDSNLIEKKITAIVAGILGKTKDKVDVNRNLSEYGFDSILFTALSSKINETWSIEITPVIFFEYLTIKEIAAHLNEKYGQVIVSSQEDVQVKETIVQEEKKTVGQEKQANQSIAIVGLSAKMPMSENAEEFWDNLIKGHDLVSEIPMERWDYHEYYGPGKESKSKWGSFLKDIDMFDNEFFGISPREAAYMDPQQRLMLEHAFLCVEDAGYKMSSLAQKRVAVLIGASSSDYTEVCRDESGYIDPYLATGISRTIISNRISHIYNLTGPSITIDTACSSSLVALDLAVTEILNGTCDSALVGGVNILLEPHTYIALSKNGMLSPDGKCKVFDEKANGYVRGEGAVMLYLKPLDAATKDGDHIYAVIKGSAQNHCGKTSTLTTPSQRAQAELITEALRKANLTPEDISYIEMHGTGTSLGDPIEVEGIKKVFAQYYFDQDKDLPQKKSCGLGSVKSNIGHLEGAAGIAGLLKTILSIEHKKLAPNIHFETLNPNIMLNDSMLYVVDKPMDWKPTKPGEPLRAGVSAFGFGGENAHVILEEYVEHAEEEEVNDEEQVFIFSAKNRNSLREYVKTFITWIEKHPEANKDAVAYQLQMGKEEMEFRLAIVSNSLAQLKECLSDSIHGMRGSRIFQSYEEKTEDRMQKDSNYINELCKKRELYQLARLWVNEIRIPWDKLWSRSFRKCSLPTYCMQKLSHWAIVEKAGAQKETIIDENRSTFEKQCYVKHMTGKERYVSDHVIAQQVIFPGAAYLEMAHEAAMRSMDKKQVKRMKNITWGQPIIYEGREQSIFVELEKKQKELQYCIYTKEDAGKKICSKGEISFEADSSITNDFPSVDEILGKCQNVRDGKDLYQYFEKNQVIYGSTYRSIEKIYSGEREALSYITLPDIRKQDLSCFTLIPSLMDGILQTVVGINLDESQTAGAFYPYSIGELDIYEKMENQLVCYARIKEKTEQYMVFDLTVWNPNQELCLSITDYIIRSSNHNSENIAYENNNQREKQIEEDSTILKMKRMLEDGILTEEDVMMLMGVMSDE